MIGFEDNVASRYTDEVERLRDPSHVRCYNLEDWHRFFEAAGCEITYIDVTSRRTYNLKEWTERAGTPREKVETIVKMLQNIPADVGKYLKVEYADGVYTLSAKNAQFLGIKTS